ncbi:MAG: SUMF1/EgtB/PvdO family nonheme iron enzyme [Candidatus Binataceae bacterium]
MAHDVFISHSARDKPYADAVCAKLESRGIRCWIAPRDIRPGMDWGAAILEGIDGARVMLLVFSSHSNASPQINREVERAVHKELIVIPVRVEDVMPTGNLEYFLGTPHWLDAITPPFERHLENIADSTRFWLERLASDRSVETSTPQPNPPQPARIEPILAPSAVSGRAPSRPKWVIPVVVVLVIAALGTAGFLATRYYLARVAPARQRREELAEQEQQRQAAKATGAAEANEKKDLEKAEGQAKQQEAQASPAAQPSTPEFASAPATAGRTFRDCEYCPQMRTVPAGVFTMGSPSSEPRRHDNEGPQHRVTIGYTFAVGKFPVTRDEYARFASESRRDSRWQNPGFAQTGNDPVVEVNWHDAKAYVAWLSEKTGHLYRLLSESEYEYLERAGTNTAYWWGDNAKDLCSRADVSECDHFGTVPVGSYAANAFGLYDMAGNVWEWTEDCWHNSYAKAPEDGTAWMTGACDRRVLRGGSWNAHARSLRSADRDADGANVRVGDNGFRVARTL